MHKWNKIPRENKEKIDEESRKKYQESNKRKGWVNQGKWLSIESHETYRGGSIERMKNREEKRSKYYQVTITKNIRQRKDDNNKRNLKVRQGEKTTNRESEFGKNRIETKRRSSK